MILEIIGYTLLVVGGFIVIMDPSCHHGHDHHSRHSNNGHRGHYSHHCHNGHYI
jgi:hypothetical protein